MYRYGYMYPYRIRICERSCGYYNSAGYTGYSTLYMCNYVQF